MQAVWFTSCDNKSSQLFLCGSETLRQLQAGAHASLGRHARDDVGGAVCVIDNRGNCVDWTGRPSKMTSNVTPMMIAVIDYKAGNLTSVVKALRFLGAD